MRDQVFLTGGTGFVGKHLLASLGEPPAHHVRCLTRRPDAVVGVDASDVVHGDLCVPATYIDALRTTDLVLHMAAVTGKARAAEYFAVNAEGTRVLLDASRAAGVKRFVYVSSIAAVYGDTKAYYYAQSKQRAEDAVRESGLNYLIVRPTIILGPGSPIGSKLATLARLCIVPVVGDGSVRVQPVCVRDVVRFLLSAIEAPALPDAAVELGGPEVITFEDLLRRVRRVVIGQDSPLMRVPVRGVIGMLDWAERWLPPILPVTAGQLSAFVNESVAAADPMVAAMVPRMTSVDDMLRRMTAHG